MVTLGVLLLSGWIAFDGGTFDLDQLPTICQGQTYPTSSCLYQPEHSSLWAPFVSFPRLDTGEAIFSVYVALVIAYLAAPLIASLTRAVAQLARTVNWRAGWRI